MFLSPRITVDLVEHIYDQVDFSLETFGPGPRTAGLLAHIASEIEEVRENPTDVEEWVDLVILALDGAWRSGATPEQIAAVLVAKMEKNKRREWPDWRGAGQDQPIEHVRSAYPS